MTIGRLLGYGCFGDVHQGVYKEKAGLEFVVAIKTLRADASVEEKRDFLTEIRLMQEIGSHKVGWLAGCLAGWMAALRKTKKKKNSKERKKEREKRTNEVSKKKEKEEGNRDAKSPPQQRDGGEVKETKRPEAAGKEQIPILCCYTCSLCSFLSSSSSSSSSFFFFPPRGRTLFR